MTATLISRLVPLAATDYARIGEAAALRGPAASPVGRGAMAHRLLAGSLDRAVDVAATLELRGYGLSGESVRFKPKPSRYDRRFWLAGAALMAIAFLELILGSGRFETYPEIQYSIGFEGPLAAFAFVACGFVTWRPGGRRRR